MLNVPPVEQGSNRRGRKGQWCLYCPPQRLTRLTPHQGTCCGSVPCKKKQKAEIDARFHAKRPGYKPDHSDDVCRDCLARGDETTMVNPIRCEACDRRAQRNGRCERCRVILVGLENEKASECWTCVQPLYLIEVLWTSLDGRMRRLFRRIRKGRVSIAQKNYLVISNPFTIVVDAQTWVSIRV